MIRADVLVVGGGPAGLATAIRARQRGMSVRLIDGAEPPIDKACGEGIMPDGVALLEKLGVDTERLEHHEFRGIRYLADGRTAEGRFRGRPGYGVRRLVLHRALVDTAERAGADLHWKTRALGLSGDIVTTTAGEMSAGWIVAADGLHSPLRHAAGLGRRPAGRKRFGSRRHFEVKPWTDLAEVHWADDCEAYVTPVAPNRVGIAVLWSGDRRPWQEMISRFPALQERIADARTASTERGMGPLEQSVRRVWRDRIALVGDASGYVDAITGEGLSLGFRQAFAVVDAIERGDLSSYAGAHRRIVLLPALMTRLLLRIKDRPRLRNRLLGILARHPRLFDRLLAMLT